MRRMLMVAGIVVALACAVALTACASQPTAAELKAKCFANQRLLKTAMDAFANDTGGQQAPFDQVVAKTGVKCPSGGAYTFDPGTGTVTCSVHGHP